jgi:hypothetical protein
MTQLIIKNEIDQSKINVLLSMIKSWNIEAEVVATVSLAKTEYKKDASFPFSVGMWEGRDIDDKKLRKLAWGTNKRRRT